MVARHVQVVAAGAAPDVVAASTAELVICADGGLEVAQRAGRRVDLVVGDLDSVTAEGVEAARVAGVAIERHPASKDESDLELAMAAAVARAATALTVHLDDGGRLDHQLANLLVLASTRWRHVEVDAWVGRHRVWVVHDRLVAPLAPDEPVAIQAVSGPALVTTSGLAYPLDRETIVPTEARGIANRVVARPAEVVVHDGVVLVISSGPQSAQAT